MKDQIRRFLVEEWHVAVFLAALVAIAHGHVYWIDDLERTAFAAASNWSLSAGIPHVQLSPVDRRDAEVWLYLIDQPRFKSHYFARTPLNRCALAHDTAEIYERINAHNTSLHQAATAARSATQKDDASSDKPNQTRDALDLLSIVKLDLLVIDLDLSPIGGPANTPADTCCQRELDELLIRRGRAASLASYPEPVPIRRGMMTAPPPYPVRLVLMKPFDADTSESTQDWMAKMEQAGVTFGDPRLRVDGGMITQYACDPTSLGGTAYRLSGGGANHCVQSTLKAINAECTADTDCHDLATRDSGLIDPEQYLRRIAFVDFRDAAAPDALCNEPASQPSTLATRVGVDDDHGTAAGAINPRVKAVFFGVGFGEDTYLTPINTIYGVEAHAATFISMLNPIYASSQLIAFFVDIAIGLALGLIIRLIWTEFFEWRFDRDANRNVFADWWPFALLVLFGLVSLLLVYVSSVVLRKSGIWLSPVPMGVGMLIESVVSGPRTYVAAQVAAEPGDRDPTFVDSLRNRIGGRLDRLRAEGKYAACVGEVFAVGIWIFVVLIALFVH